jgi:amidase
MSQTIGPFSTASAMKAALASKQISVRELLDLHEGQIAQHNPKLNVIVERDPDRTRADAQAAEAALARGESAPLLGLPITLKESMNVRGLRTTVGIPMWSQFRSEHDGAIAAATHTAGAVLLGKTNIAPMLFDWQANNPVYGRTLNPWDLTRTPGGSTGGAAAVAAGLTPLEYGSDIGGSIRVPASFCGVYGHKPSESALPRSGQFPFPPLPNPASMMGVQGPLARSAADLELGFDAVAGPEVGEDVAWKLVLPPARHTRLADYRVAVLPAVAWLPVAGEVLDAQERLITRLSKLGCKVERVQPDGMGDHRDNFALYQTLLTAATGAGAPKELRQRRLELLRTRNDSDANAQILGLEGWAGDYLLWSGARQRVRAAWQAFFSAWDVLVCPAFFRLSFVQFDHPFPPDPRNRPLIDVDGQSVPYDFGLFYPSIATLPGLPATAFPIELSREGLPLGMQVVGPYLEDRTTMRFAALMEREWGGFQPPPDFV